MSADNDLLTVTMFGEMRIRVNNLPIPRLSTKAQELFALLVLWNELPISRKRLASTLWPSSKLPNALSLMRTNLMELRRALGPAAVRLPTENRMTIHLDLRGATVDILEFDRALKTGSPDAIQAALTLYKQDLLVGWQAEWVLPEREHRALAYARALQRTSPVTLAGTSSPVTTAQTGTPSSDPFATSLTPTQLHGVLAEIRTILAQNRRQLQHTSDQLERLERQLVKIDPDAVAQDSASRARSLYTLGVSKHLDGDLEGARACQEQVLQITRLLDDPAVQLIQARALDQLGRLEMSASTETAFRHHKRAYEMRIEHHRGILRDVVSSLLAMGDAASTLAETLEYYAKALRMAQTNRDESGIAWSHFSLAIAPVFRNAWERTALREILAHFERAMNGFIAAADPTGLFAVLDGVARVCHQVGHYSGAARMIEIEALLRTEYSAPQTVKDIDGSTSTFAAFRREITAAAATLAGSAGLDWAAAVSEVKKLIRDLPEIAYAGSV